MDTPKISVVMTAYNEEKTIGSAIESILNQTFKDFELIVVNDGSNDKTEDIVKRIADPRIVYIKNDKNKGMSTSRNRGILLARGDYIAIFDADDISYPNRLEKQLDFMVQNPTIVLSGTWGVLKTQDGKRVNFKQPCTSQEIENCIIYTCPIIDSSLIAKKDILKKYLYNPKLGRGQDYDLFLRLAKNHKLANIPEYLISYDSSFSLKYQIRDHFWKTYVRCNAFFKYGYPLKKIYWIFASLIIVLLPVRLKFYIKEKIVGER